VTLLVDRGGVQALRPAGALTSVMVPAAPFGYDVIETFCHRVHFFASNLTAASWVSEQPGMALLPVETAFELGRALSQHIPGARK